MVAESNSSLQAKVAGSGFALRLMTMVFPSSLILAAVTSRLAATQTFEQGVLTYALVPEGQDS
jgi:hypothetical protein